MAFLCSTVTLSSNASQVGFSGMGKVLSVDVNKKKAPSKRSFNTTCGAFVSSIGLANEV